jgi:molybdenum cofactor cytidylyltransferase
MGYSIAAGVAARSDASGWLILPADMPMVQTRTLHIVANELESHAIAYAQYRGRRGHPVGFSAELYSELVMLTGDEGARRLVARYPALGVEVDDPGVLLDVDTEDDLARVRAAQAQQQMQFREAR